MKQMKLCGETAGTNWKEEKDWIEKVNSYAPVADK